MTDWIPLGDVSEIKPGSRKLYTLKGTEIAVFHVAGPDQPGMFYAVEDSCPHQGASLIEGDGCGTEVNCPLHDWTFDVATGECLDFPEFPLTRFELKEEAGLLLVNAAAFADAQATNVFLVRYSVMGWVDHFSADAEDTYRHRDRVVLQTSRGEELGEILSSIEASDQSATPAGSILREFTPLDQEQLPVGNELTAEVFRDCRELIQERGMPTEIIDCEQLFDQQTVVLYYLGSRLPALEILAQELNARYPWRIVFHPVDEAPAASGCSDGGCGCDQK